MLGCLIVSYFGEGYSSKITNDSFSSLSVKEKIMLWHTNFFCLEVSKISHKIDVLKVQGTKSSGMNIYEWKDSP